MLLGYYVQPWWCGVPWLGKHKGLTVWFWCVHATSYGIKWWMKVITQDMFYFDGNLFTETSIDFMKRGLWTMCLSCRVRQGCVMYCAQRIIHFRLGWTYEMPLNPIEETSRIEKSTIDIYIYIANNQRSEHDAKVQSLPAPLQLHEHDMYEMEFCRVRYILLVDVFMLHAHPHCLVQGIQRDLLHHATFR